MWYIIRSSTAGVVFSAVLVLTGCAGHTFSPDASGTSTVPATIAPDLSYRFLLDNYTTYDLEMESFSGVCMDEDLHGTLRAKETKDVTIETHNRNGCLFDVSRFTTKFKDKADGLWREVHLSKADFHPWEDRTLGGELKVKFTLQQSPTHYVLSITKL
jgi:hypothetical protein